MTLKSKMAINGKTNTNPPGSSHGEQLVENRLTLDHIVLTKNAMVIPFLFPSDDTCESEQIVSYTSWNCPGGREQSDSSWCDKFPASNILSLDVDQWGENYWISEEKKTGEEQGFILYLGCSKTVRGVSLRNTHGAHYRDRSTKKFRILGSSTNNGPWQELLVADLEDSRNQDPPPVQQLMFANSAVVSFIKFELLDFYGNGGGLQYFAVREGSRKKNP